MAREYLNETGLASLWAKIVNKINALGDLCVKKAGDTMTGELTTPYLTINGVGGELKLKTNSSSSDDSADIAFYYGNGQEKSRIYMNDIPTTINDSRPKYRAYKSDGTLLQYGFLATSNDTQSLLDMYDGLKDAKVAKAGDTMTGQLKTSYKTSVAMGSYGSSQTTVPNFCNEVRYSSGCMGSVNFTTAFTKNGITILAGWYNFIYSPHRTGGKDGGADGDNTSYGTLILNTMTTGSTYFTYILRVTGSSSDNYVGGLRRVYTTDDGKCCKGGTLVITFNGSGYRDVAASSFGFSVKPNALVITPQSNSKAIISYDFDNSSDTTIRIYGYAINSSNQLYNLNGNVRIGWMSVDG